VQEIRCGYCSRKLGVGEYVKLQIKCPRCGTLNHFRAASHAPEHRGAPEKDSAHATHGKKS
jgi:phage FluMu protein Com